MELRGQRVVVLGGTSGIGLAVARAAAGRGAEVVVASSREASVKRALAELPDGVTGHAVDLSDGERVAELFDTLGALDHLVYTAGDTLELTRVTDLDAGVEVARRFFGVRYFGALAVELAPIRVNAVSPGIVRSPLWANLPEAEREGQYAAAAAASLPVGRVGEPDDLAEAYLALVTQPFATGTVLTVDGGGVLV